MRRVVGADAANASVGERGAQGIAVGRRFDRRVALDACAESFVVGLGEEQMRQTGLGRDERIVGSEEFEFTSRREVRHMQARLGGFGQFDGVFRALQAGFGRTNFGVMSHMRIRTVARLVLLHRLHDHRRVFAVHHDRQSTLFEHREERLRVGHMERTGAAAHEQFHTGHQSRVDLAQVLGVVGRGADKETEIHMTQVLGSCDFLLQGFGCHGGGDGVGHVEHGGHTARSGGTAFAVEIRFVGQSRIAEMHVFVDGSRQKVATVGVDHRIGGQYRVDIATDEYFLDAIVFNDDTSDLTAAFVDEDGVFNERSSMHKS